MADLPVGGNNLNINPNNFTALVNVLQNMLQLQSATYKTLTKLTGNLSANYATGTWTPALTFGGGSTGLTTSAAAGTYTVLGREVICRFHIVLTAKGSSTGVAAIGGLPFTSNADATNAGSSGIISSYANLSGLGGVPLLNVGSSSTSIALLSAGAAATAALADTNFTNTSAINGQVSFFT